MRPILKKPAQPVSREQKMQFILDREFHPPLLQDVAAVEQGLKRGLTLDQVLQKFAHEHDYVETPVAERMPPEFIKEALARVQELRQISDHDLDALYHQTKDRERLARAAAEDEHRPFNNPSARTIGHHWGRKAYWTVDEATAICLGRNPERVNWASISPWLNVSPFTARYSDIRDLIRRAAETSEVGDPNRIRPKKFLGWIKRTLPEYQANLQAVVQEGWIAEEKDSDGSESINNTNPGESVTAKDLNSLYYMLAGMAIWKYGLHPDYDPAGEAETKSRAFSAIRHDLDQAGISLDIKPIREHLQEALRYAKRKPFKLKENRALREQK